MRSIAILALLLTASLFLVMVPLEGDGQSEETKQVRLYFGGSPISLKFNTTLQGKRVTITDEDINAAWYLSDHYGLIGTWETDPLLDSITIMGYPHVELYARGVNATLSGAYFRIEISTSMSDQPTYAFDTDPVDLDQTFGRFNVTSSERVDYLLSEGERLYVTLYWKAGETYNDVVNGHDTIEFGFGSNEAPSAMSVGMNSVEVGVIGTDIGGYMENTVLFRVMATSKLGSTDIVNASIVDEYPGEFVQLGVEGCWSGAVFTILWDFRFVNIDGGAYQLTVLAQDMSGNRWAEHVTVTIDPSNVWADITVREENITFMSAAPSQGDEVTVVINLEGTGLNWDTVSVDVTLYDGSWLIERKTVTVKRGMTNRVEIEWTPDYAGQHTIRVEIDESSIPFAVRDQGNNVANKVVTVSPPSTLPEDPVEDFLLPPYGWSIAIVVLLVIVASVFIARTTHLEHERREWDRHRERHYRRHGHSAPPPAPAHTVVAIPPPPQVVGPSIPPWGERR